MVVGIGLIQGTGGFTKFIYSRIHCEGMRWTGEPCEAWRYPAMPIRLSMSVNSRVQRA